MAVIIGTELRDTLEGSSEADLFLAGDGNDDLRSFGGDDTLLGEGGNDSLMFSTYSGGEGAALLDGGAGDDALRAFVGAYDQTVIGGAGNDTLTLYSTTDSLFTVSLGEGADVVTIVGDNGGTVAGSYTVRISDFVFGEDELHYATRTSVSRLCVSERDGELVLSPLHPSANISYVLEGYTLEDFLAIAPEDRSFTLWNLITGTEGADVLTGYDKYGAFDNWADVIAAGAGDDSVSGGTGDDTLLGEAGSDTLIGGLGNDSLSGGDGDDFLSGDPSTYGLAGSDDDLLHGGAGNDVLVSITGADTLYGDAGDDRLGVAHYQFLAVDLYGGEGNDWLFSGFMGGVLDGGEGADEINLAGHDGAEYTITLGEGADRVQVFNGVGYDAPDYASGAFHATITDFTLGEDEIALYDLFVEGSSLFLDLEGFGPSGARDFTISGDATRTVLTTDTGATITLEGVAIAEMIARSGMSFGNLTEGTAGDDRMVSAADTDDVLSCGDGDDPANGGAGNDILLGGAGADTLGANAGNDTIDGGAGDDVIYGHKGNNLLLGGAGNDWISSGDQSSTLEGGAGDDTLDLRMKAGGDHVVSGGAGADSFDFVYLDARKQGDVTITDFEIGLDSLTIAGQSAQDYLAGHAGATLADTGAGALLTLAEGDTILFAGLAAQAVSEGLFGDPMAGLLA